MSNVKKEMKSLEKLKNKMNKLLSSYGSLQKVHSHEILEDLQKTQLNQFRGNVVNLKECNIDCPAGFSKLVTENKCQCISSWNKDCGENCAFEKCNQKNLEWIPLDYTKNPYTCDSKSSKKTNNFFVSSNDTIHKVYPSSLNCKKEPLTTNYYVQGFLENNGFTLGKPLNKSQPCEVSLSTTSYSKDVKKINDKLLKLASKTHKKIISLQKRKQIVDHESSLDEQQIKEDLKEYEDFIKSFKEFSVNNPSLDGMNEDTSLRVNSQYTQYLLYLFLVVILLFFIFYHLQK